MSLRATSWAWRIQTDQPSVKLLLLALADFADAKGQAWPSIETLASMTGLSRRSISRAILEAKGLSVLAVKKRPNTSSYYELIFEPELPLGLPSGDANLALPGTSGDANMATPDQSGEANLSPRRRQFGTSESPNSTPRHDNLAQNPIRTVNEPSREPSEAQGSLIDDLDDGPPTRTAKTGRKPVNGHHREAKRPGLAHHPCPIDFEPSDKAALYCKTKGLELEPTVRAFVNHWTSEKQTKTKRPGWDASFMSWCDNEIRFAAKAGRPINGGASHGDSRPQWEIDRQRRIKEAAREDT